MSLLHTTMLSSVAVNVQCATCMPCGGVPTMPMWRCRGMSSESVTCFVPETCGSLIHGLEFHRFYFDNGENSLRHSH